MRSDRVFVRTMSTRRSAWRRAFEEAIHFLAALSLPTGLLVTAVASALTYVGLVKKKDVSDRALERDEQRDQHR
jgi:hypothetical protein